MWKKHPKEQETILKLETSSNTSTTPEEMEIESDKSITPEKTRSNSGNFDSALKQVSPIFAEEYIFDPRITLICQSKTNEVEADLSPYFPFIQKLVDKGCLVTMDKSDPKISILMIIGDDDDYEQQLLNIDLSKLQILFLIRTIINPSLRNRLADVKKLDYLHIEGDYDSNDPFLCSLEWIKMLYIRFNLLMRSNLMDCQVMTVFSGEDCTLSMSQESLRMASIPSCRLKVNINDPQLINLKLISDPQALFISDCLVYFNISSPLKTLTIKPLYPELFRLFVFVESFPYLEEAIIPRGLMVHMYTGEYVPFESLCPETCKFKYFESTYRLKYIETEQKLVPYKDA